ncbi:MAG: TonB-dependent receptor [Verrucomicrobia bacterium]|nr:TonB-dependent receptor [Verrucomicrobiota bacterium]
MHAEPFRFTVFAHTFPVALGRLLLVFVASGALLSRDLPAQPAATGSITGTVANGNTRLFLNDAEIRIEGTATATLTDRAGAFTLPGLRPGTYELVVSYTGLDSERRSVTVTPGTATKQEFNLTSQIYQLQAFVVASEVEGNAAAINQQKKSDHFMQAISADTLGNVAEGNIGEFLRYVPGIQVNFVNADASTVSMRGQEPEATLFTFDGQVPAAAGTPPRSSTGSSDASSRAFEFSQATIANIETIEIYKAPPPWMAPSTGGVVNAVTKNAFAQKGRRFSTTLSLSANSEMMRWQIPGPGSRTTERIKPGGSLNYSEAFLNNTLGLSLSYFESNVINPSHNYAMTYSPFTAGNAANPVTENSRFNVNTFTLVDGPQAKNRRTLSLNADYRLGAHTVLKLKTSANTYLSQNRSHTFRVRPGQIDPASTTTDAIVRNALVDVFNDYSDSVSQSYGYVGAVEHKFGPWKIEYSANYAKSDSKVTDLPAMIQSMQFNLVAADAVVVRLTADPNTPAPLTMVQTAGPDLYDLNSYNSRKSFSLQTSPRFQNDRTWNLKFDLRRNFADFRFPFDVRAGASLYQLHRRKMAGQIVLNYTGPDGIANNADDPILVASQFTKTTYGDKFLYGIRTPPLVDPYKFAAFMTANPNAVQDIQGQNIQRQRVNTQQMAQDVTAAYLASSIHLTPTWTVVAGVRGEQTENFVRGAIRINSLGVPILAQGFTNTSKPYFDAIYSQTQRATTKYTDYFPNFQTTYRLRPDLLLRGAVTRSMSRPGVQTILPNTTVNDTAAIPSVTVNNTGLLPTYSRNLDLQLEYFPSGANKIEIGWFRKTVTNYIVNSTEVIQPGTDNGFDGQYAGYNLVTQDNGGKGQFEGVEVSVRQSLQPYLKFAPEYLRGWEIFGGYNKNLKGEAPNRAGVITKPLAPNYYDWNANWGVSYMTPRRTLYFNVRTTIFPEAITTAATATDLRPVYESSHQRWDATARWMITRNYSLELTGANLTNDSWRNFYQGGRNTSRRTFGTNYTLSFRANLDQMRLPFLDRKN